MHDIIQHKVRPWAAVLHVRIIWVEIDFCFARRPVNNVHVDYVFRVESVNHLLHHDHRIVMVGGQRWNEHQEIGVNFLLQTGGIDSVECSSGNWKLKSVSLDAQVIGFSDSLQVLKITNQQQIQFVDDIVPAHIQIGMSYSELLWVMQNVMH